MSGAYWGDRTDSSPAALALRRLRLPCKECGGVYVARFQRVRHRKGCSEIPYRQQDVETATLADLRSPVWAKQEIGEEWDYHSAEEDRL